MPELPEVETVVRTLRPHVVGSQLSHVWCSGKTMRLRKPIDEVLLRRVTNQAAVTAIERKGKYILFFTERGIVLFHLGMTGQLRIQPAAMPRPPHTHVAWCLGQAQELRFVDPRRFGWIEAKKRGESFACLTALGPDPLDEMDQKSFCHMLASSQATIKSVLLDQRKIAGLGNIYVCEALYRAGVHPFCPAHQVGQDATKLFRAIGDSLRMGIQHRGTSLRDYVDGDGRQGSHQQSLKVYGREGKPCHRCGSSIARTVGGGRSTFYCPCCQAAKARSAR